MKKLFDSFVANWRAVVWSVLYVAVMWAVLRGLFGFNMFSSAHWARMANIQLHGFAGLVFGLMVLAAVPLYIATTVLTVRNKAVPINIPLPNCFTPPPPEPQEQPVRPPVVTAREPLPELPHGVPQEMREVFMRAKKNYGARQMSAFNKTPMADFAPTMPQPLSQDVPQTGSEQIRASGQGATVAPPVSTDVSDTVQDTNVGLPIPDSFDFAPSNDDDIPVFSDITFDDDDEIAETPSNDDAPDAQSELCELLSDAGIDVELRDDLIVANGFAIATHADSDFWVADELDWFAAGKRKPSPIVALTAVRDELKPVLYLGANNIMDLDTLSQQWRDSGIEVVSNLDELLKLIQESV